MLKTSLRHGAGILVAAFALAGTAQAALITNGFTFAVASASSSTTAGSHFHSNTGGSFGNPAGKAEVGRYSSEEVRGLSEYSLIGQSAASSAFVTFNVFSAGGLFSGTNSTPFTGNIIVEAYAGNNLEDLTDYQATSLGTVGTFNVAAGVNNAGDIFSFDVTAFFNNVVTSSGTSLGIRLRESTANADYSSSKAWTFESFRLTSDNQCTGAGCNINPGGGGGTVPLPGSLALVALGLLGSAALRRRF